MSAATSSQQPVVPPRPGRSPQSLPKVPPRPLRALERSLSPGKDRFAPSPLNEAQFLSRSPGGASSIGLSKLPETDENCTTVELPSLGQEGQEYAAVEELSSARSQASSTRASSPEHTRTIGADIKLHAPKPSLPASSAVERVAAVTRTDSEKAFSFGIGRRSSEDASQPHSTAKKGSTGSQELLSSDEIVEDEHGIPEIGRQVPMYPNAGDVQAPSTAIAVEGDDPVTKKPQLGKSSARGFDELPPGSYGLHGHGVMPSDKLEKAYYSKHPELVKLEHTPHHADRAQDYSKTSDELNKLVHETGDHGLNTGAYDITSTPSEQVGWQAIEESTSRPASVAPKGKSSSFGSYTPATSSVPKPALPTATKTSFDNQPSTIIHIDDSSRRKSVMFSDDEVDLEAENETPILALDEVAKHPSAYVHEPAVAPLLERRTSSVEGSSSRPSSRPVSVYKPDEEPEEVEYEPLFPAGHNEPENISLLSSKAQAAEETARRFPSRDIWEDAPNSAHHTAVVSTPESPVVESTEKFQTREGETAAQAFARRQEELAEQGLHGADTFAENRKANKQSPWIQQQPHPVKNNMIGTAAASATLGSPVPASVTSSPAASNRRPGLTQRFPSRDVWEDAPESLQLETTVSTPQEDETSSPADSLKPMVPKRPVRKLTDPEKALPLVPSRPKPKIGSNEAVPEETAVATFPTKAVTPDKPKPSVPARQLKSSLVQSFVDKEAEVSAPKQKPAIPARPMGGKIAQLQASFMSDLNNRLKIGPQAPKKEESTAPEEEAAPEAEKAPLVDARKGRARGPQRRAPQSSPSPAAAGLATGTAPVATSAPLALSFSTPTTLFSLDPKDDIISVHSTTKFEHVAVANELEGKEAEAEADCKVEDASMAVDIVANTPVPAILESAEEEVAKKETSIVDTAIEAESEVEKKVEEQKESETEVAE